MFITTFPYIYFFSRCLLQLEIEQHFKLFTLQIYTISYWHFTQIKSFIHISKLAIHGPAPKGLLSGIFFENLASLDWSVTLFNYPLRSTIIGASFLLLCCEQVSIQRTNESINQSVRHLRTWYCSSSINDKGKVNPLSLTEHHAMKTYWWVEV